MHHGLLDEALALPAETRAEGRGALSEIVGQDLAVFDPAAGARGAEGGPFVDGAVAVDALDGGDGAGLGGEEAVAVNVGGEMAVHALHAAGKVNILEVDGFLEFFRIVV